MTPAMLAKLESIRRRLEERKANQPAVVPAYADAWRQWCESALLRGEYGWTEFYLKPSPCKEG